MKKILKVTLIIIVILFVIVFLGQIIIYDTPSKKSKDIMTNKKLNQAIRSYEPVAYNPNEYIKNDCEKIGEYFKIDKKDGCKFSTIYDEYWQFNQDGSATVTIQTINGEQHLSMGICKDGTINCPEEYPEIETIKNIQKILYNNFKDKE